jgi:hypothetical protein
LVGDVEVVTLGLQMQALTRTVRMCLAPAIRPLALLSTSRVGNEFGEPLARAGDAMGAQSLRTDGERFGLNNAMGADRASIAVGSKFEAVVSGISSVGVSLTLEAQPRP